MSQFIFGLFGLLLIGWGAVAPASPHCDQQPYSTWNSPIALSTCLPETMDPNLLETKGFVPYQSDFAHAPIANGNIYANGKDAEETNILSRLFVQKHWARLPSGQKIKVTPSAEGPLWNYPVGTQIVHMISWNSWPKTELYELRVIKKLHSGLWAFGVYIPVAGSPLLTLRKDETTPLVVHDFKARAGDRFENFHVEMNRLHPQSCRDCHASHGTATYQFGITSPPALKRSYAGPCHFTPFRSDLMQGWAAEYKKAHGLSPFETTASPLLK